MSNHQNRSNNKTASSNPSPAEIRAARKAAGLTQTEACKLVFVSARNWQQWEGAERRMHPGLWELFMIKAAIQ